MANISLTMTVLKGTAVVLSLIVLGVAAGLQAALSAYCEPTGSLKMNSHARGSERSGMLIIRLFQLHRQLKSVSTVHFIKGEVRLTCAAPLGAPSSLALS